MRYIYVFMLAAVMSGCVDAHKEECQRLYNKTLIDITNQNPEMLADLTILKGQCQEYLK
jgi:hypothetical protein